MLEPWNAAALPEIMAEALQESKRRGKQALCARTFHEGRAAGQQPGCVAGARGVGAAEAKARPNVEVNRRAEGTSELNRRLGAVGGHRQHSFGIRAGNCQQRAGRATRLFATLLPSL